MEPVSRIELLAAGVQIEPVSRLEKFVAAAAGTYELPADLQPVSRLEYFLSQIAGGGGGPTPGDGTLIKANTFLYLSNLVNIGQAGTFNLRPTLSAGNPFDKPGFYLRAKTHFSGPSYGSSTFHYAVGFGGTINSFNSGNANTFFICDYYPNDTTKALILAFQRSSRVIIETFGDSASFEMTIDSLTVNNSPVTLTDAMLETLDNIANLTATDFRIGYSGTGNFAVRLVIDELEIGVIST